MTVARKTRWRRRPAELPPERIDQLIRQYAAETDPAKAAKIEKQILEGYYGKPIDELDVEDPTKPPQSLTKLAKKVLGAAGARSWMNRPQFGLGGRIPAQVCRSAAGAKEVEQLLKRIDADVLP
jgi:Antitoxin Xre/MbcA/ParS C-terminal toxin-binding domain